MEKILLLLLFVVVVCLSNLFLFKFLIFIDFPLLSSPVMFILSCWYLCLPTPLLENEEILLISGTVVHCDYIFQAVPLIIPVLWNMYLLIQQNFLWKLKWWNNYSECHFRWKYKLSWFYKEMWLLCSCCLFVHLHLSSNFWTYSLNPSTKPDGGIVVLKTTSHYLWKLIYWRVGGGW